MTTERAVFPNAPIVEAVIDLRVQLPENFEPAVLNSYHDLIKEHYPEKKIQRFIKSGIKITDGMDGQVDTTTGIKGIQFNSKEEKKVVQVQIDGFTFSKLKPYERWDVFVAEGKELWNKYKVLTKTLKVVRLALRYINRIDAPLPFGDFNEYILTNPQIAPNLPQSVSNFFMRLEIPNNSIDAIAIITQTIDLNTVNNFKVPLILDIDVVHNCEHDPEDEKIWDIFETLRVFKNDIFFNSITEKTKELFL